MNFRTRLSYNNRLLFVYKNGDVKQTRFIEVAYFGDNYVLAKTNDSAFYTLLDLDGNEIENEKYIIHRFQNGLLLTYSFFDKSYRSSDGIGYSINYNVYKLFNHDTGKSFVVNVIQSDNLLKEAMVGEAVENKLRLTPVVDFLNKPVYCFKDFVFSELLDNQFLIVGSHFDLTNSKSSSFSFNSAKDKKIWGVVDILACKEYNNDTDVNRLNFSRLTFNEAEFKLSELMILPERPLGEDYEDKTVFNDVASEFKLYSSWKRKNKWKWMFSSMLSLSTN